MGNKVNINNILNIISYCIYISLLPSGIIIICERYQYFGGYPELSNPNILLNSLSYTLLILGFLLTSKLKITLLKIYQMTSLIIIFTPALLIFPRWDEIYEFHLWRVYVLTATFLILPFMIDYFIKGRQLNVNRSKVLSIYPLFFLGVLVCFVVIITFPRANLNGMLDIYANRMSMRENMPTFPGAGYLYGLTSRFFVPILIVISVLERSKVLLFLSVGCGILVFSIGSHKSVIGLMIIAYILANMERRNRFRNFDFLFYALCVLNVLLVVSILASFNVFFEYIWIIFGDVLRRISILPAILFLYYAHLELFLSLNVLGEKLMDGNLQFYVGEHIFNRPGMRANATSYGLIPFKYGYIGTVNFSISTTLFFILMHSYIGNRNRRIEKVFFIMVCLYVWGFLESQFTVVLFTHGFWFIIFLLMMSQFAGVRNGK